MSVYSMLTPDDPNRDENVGGSGGAWWWHSEHETIDKYDPEILAQDTRLYAATLHRLATADVLPFDLGAIAQDYLDALREYDEAAGDVLPLADLIAEVRRLKASAEALHARLAGATGQALTGRANRLFLAVTRALNPVLYQSTTPFAHDPALASRALPALGPVLSLKKQDPASDAYKFARVGILRRMNQVRHQVRTAARLIAAFDAPSA